MQDSRYRGLYASRKACQMSLSCETRATLLQGPNFGLALSIPLLRIQILVDQYTACSLIYLQHILAMATDAPLHGYELRSQAPLNRDRKLHASFLVNLYFRAKRPRLITI